MATWPTAIYGGRSFPGRAACPHAPQHSVASAHEDLAMAVLLQTVRDLQVGTERNRMTARDSVVLGGITYWLDCLPISAEARARVIGLLENLASQVPPWRR